MSPNNIDLLESILEKTAGIIENVKSEQLLLSSPCPDFDVKALVAHLVSWLNKFAQEAALPDTKVDPTAYKFSDTPAADFRKHASALIKALRGLAEPPAMMGIQMVEYIVHGWDLAKATGQDTNYSDAEVKAALQSAQAMMKPEYRGAGKSFGAEVKAPAGTNLTEQLVAFMGRQPDWSPSSHR